MRKLVPSLFSIVIAVLFLAPDVWGQNNGTVIPDGVKIDRNGKQLTASEHTFLWSELQESDDEDVFPGCIDGQFYVGFQLYYDVMGHRNTTIDWMGSYTIALLHDEDTLWNKSVQIDMESQTFIATVFHETLVTCDGNYHFAIAKKDSIGNVPADFVYLKVLLFEKTDDQFTPSANLDLVSSYANGVTTLGWNYAGTGALEYDIEWVFIEEHENFTGTTAKDAFKFKRAVRITTGSTHYTHLVHYPAGIIWYRARAAGRSSEDPAHRIVGYWFYAASPHTINNPQPNITWQQQTVFAEEGKYKKVITYYDGSLRPRQTLTNLNTEGVTLVGDVLYDYEGRKSVDIMAVPATDASLTYKPGLNVFEALDPAVTAHTSSTRKKFHYDNYRINNSKLTDDTGASQYYSSFNTSNSIHKDFIPDGEGYVYNQTEYLRDGTGRISRQSGVGKEFRIDGNHVSRNYYGAPAKEELIRLFGTNVGNASHYKKNLIVDPNGQVAVAYLDQEGRTIATALAGDKPANVEALKSYTDLSTEPLTVNIIDKNVKEGSVSQTVHTILNPSPNRYTFKYDLAAFASQIGSFGCPNCVFDLKITLTDPDGTIMNLSAFAGNQSIDGLSYERKSITASGCSDTTFVNDVEFDTLLMEIGDYTLTKTLTAREMSFEQMKALMEQDSSIQAQIEELKSTYVVDPADCEICVSDCPGMEDLINETITEIAYLDCDNILQQILNDLKTDLQSVYPDSAEYEPTQAEIEGHELYCKYLLCNKNVTSDIFDKQLARIPNWTTAISIYPSVLDSDPFFNVDSLSGSDSKEAMVSSLADIYVGTVGYDNDGDGEQDGSKVYRGAISTISDPANTDFYVNTLGKPDVNGYHILYLDVMTERSQLGETAYQAELDSQRWVMYRNFYLEAKRKIKLSLNAYNTCATAREELEIADELNELDTEEEVEEWATENNAMGYDSVSTAEIEMSLQSIRMACDIELTSSDSAAIAGHLVSYFNENPNNILRVIITTDIGTNPHLDSIQNILDSYSCDLNEVTQEDPLSCVKDTTVSFMEGIGVLSSPVALMASDSESSAAGSEEQAARKRETEARRVANQQALNALILPGLYDQPQAESVKTKRSASTVSMLLVKEPTPEEWAALWEFYDSTGGPNWVNRTGWSAADRNVIQDVTGWFGIQTNSAGNVIGIDMRTNFISWQQYCNNLTGTLPQEMGDLVNLQVLDLMCNHITGPLPSSLQDLVNLKKLELSSNNIQGPFPSFLKNMTGLEHLGLSDNPLNQAYPSDVRYLINLKILNFNNCGLTGAIPASVAKLENLEVLNLSENSLSGPIPDSVGYMIHLTELDLSYNSLTNSIPASFSNLASVDYLALNNNALSGTIPEHSLNSNGVRYYVDISHNQFYGDLLPAIGDRWIYNFYIHNNKFTFTDIIEVARTNCSYEVVTYYAPQDSIDQKETIIVVDGKNLTLTTTVDRNSVNPSLYQWFKDGVALAQTPVPSLTGHTITIPNVSSSASGHYYVKITNDDESFTACDDMGADRLTLISRPKTVNVIPDSARQYYTICLEYDTANTTVKEFTVTVDLGKAFEECMKNEAAEDSVLIAYAIEKLMDSQASSFYSQYRTKCFKNAQEALSYTFVPKEYHYTLYYFDQAGNLEQTVPPKGVSPLSNEQVIDFVEDGIHIDPPHTLITRYQYGSLNQLVWQKTPDAGESRFWYNEKGQLRLSQNAQQFLDTTYSYTRYDALGRIVEVGEMASADSVSTLVSRLDSIAFPAFDKYTLTDITSTYYDFGDPVMAAQFPQENLRTRVSWVEVTDKISGDTVATYYTYDIHGNVKALLQKLPGLEPKRTDYLYDLVSGKVNLVMYAYGEPDQFIHKYTYDADNRITDVHTSSDGFIWDRDAAYRYYKHGPLARTELGEYRVQGQDYYYTLQGWIKGVNMPFADDPDVGNTYDQGAGKDAYAYTLGYYQGDYKPITAGLTTADERDHLWTRLNEVNGHTGLFNGNISWMITDLAKIGEVNNDRQKGMQAMLYQYDQLHRIVRSRSLAAYTAASGFAAPTGTYDEDYTYDPNGNILTLQRKNEAGSIADDFDYVYYANTNRLREVVPVTKDKVYSSGPVRTDNIVYRNVTINGSAYVPQGSNVEVKALENVLMDPAFESPDGTDFWAHILADEGTYQYDAIGNLILDQSEGVKISWTPYGKVREVHTKGDSIAVYFRYDGTGNRVEKKMVRRDTVSNIAVTRYVRDASGNVMAIYKDTVMTEQPIYGSSRIGQFTGAREEGTRTLGERKFELSNHLDNVLVVITDHAGMEEDSVWAVVMSANDYYPFGLEMQRREYVDTTASYRYGFNGKEKDESGEFGNTHYDYGFRIYNPSIGRFLSVDPLITSYPWYTPYQFAGNKPIRFADLDGLEELDKIEAAAATAGTTVITTETVGTMTYQEAIKFVSGNAPKLEWISILARWSPLILLTLQGDESKRDFTTADLNKWKDQIDDNELDQLEQRIKRDGCISEQDEDRYLELLAARRGIFRNKEDIYKKINRPFGDYNDLNYSKHSSEKVGNVGARPLDGQEALNNSVLVKQKRVGFSQRVSVEGEHFVVLDEHQPGQFHGHQRSWSELSQDQKNTLIKNKITDVKGRILNKKNGN